VPNGAPKIPDLIEVERRGKYTSLRIDGVEFPWALTDDGISTAVVRGGEPGVALTILANEVRVIDSNEQSRERVYILAASKDEAAIFAQEWVEASPGRALTDAVPLGDLGSPPDGLRPTDTVVELPGATLNPQCSTLRSVLAAKGIPIIEIEGTTGGRATPGG
jgi:hypothetical protein